MRVAILLSALLAVCLSTTQEEYRTAFVSWMKENDKVYMMEDFNERFEIFKSNYDYVQNFDVNAHTFTVALNAFSDLSSAEFTSMYTGLNYVYEEKSEYVPAHYPEVPTSVDWRTKGAVTHVKNQGQCGSCWSFSTTGGMEGVHEITTGKLVSFSEQQLVDCSGSFGNQGCNGGLMDDAFKYIVATKGLATEKAYPYTAKDGTCHYDPKTSGGTITGYKDVTSKSETALTAAIVNSPISVAIDASHSSFQMYSSGVYYEPACSQTQLDHGVLAVGYGTESGKDYYIVKNSWAASWGMKGYINMSRNRNNNCGIATMASYPTGASTE